MCAISGFISFNFGINGRDYYCAHTEMAHRGPDDEGFYIETTNFKGFAGGHDTERQIEHQHNVFTLDNLKLVLGHRRLSIIDLSNAGHQPLKIRNKVITYNGEIYNYIELKEELQQLGYTFKTSTDTEVFLIAYEHWGQKAFEKFNGMWAAAIYDIKLNTIVLTRDRFGIKPLYYTVTDSGFYFASEIKFFKKLNLIRDVDEQVIFQYLRYSEIDFDKRTFFKNIYQLEPGYFLTLKDSEIRFTKSWDIHKLDDNNLDKKSLKATLQDAIKLRLRADVGVGSLLSGGIDSSLIVGFIKNIVGLGNYKAYSAVFNEKEYSEKKYIDNNAKYLSFTPNYIYPEPSDLVENIEQLIYIQEMPFRSLSVLSQFLIYQEISKQKKVKVLLNGQGADEIFTGYNTHYSFYFIHLLFRFRFRLLTREMLLLCKYKKLNIRSVLIKTFKDYLSTYISQNNNLKLFKKSFKRSKLSSVKNNFSILKNKLYRNLSFSALPEYLRYEDRNSMYFSLESRLPFLDFRLVQHAFALSDVEYIVDGITKRPLRNICKGMVDNSIIERKDKTGFISPQEMWQKNDLKNEFDNTFLKIKKEGLFPFIDENIIYTLYLKYQNNKFDDWTLIWRIYCLYKWKKVWFS